MKLLVLDEADNLTLPRHYTLITPTTKLELRVISNNFSQRFGSDIENETIAKASLIL